MAQAAKPIVKLDLRERRHAKSHAASILSGIIVIGTLGMYAFLIIHGEPERLGGVVLGRILGTLDTAFGIVLAYWLGSSAQSHSKDETISRMGGAQQEPSK